MAEKGGGGFFPGGKSALKSSGTGFSSCNFFLAQKWIIFWEDAPAQLLNYMFWIIICEILYYWVDHPWAYTNSLGIWSSGRLIDIPRG